MSQSGVQGWLQNEVEQIYLLHQPWLKAWLVRKMADTHGAADIAQDVFLRLLTRGNAVPVQEPRALLVRMAQRALVSRWRREQLERAYLDALALQPQAVAPSPEALAIITETMLELDQLLGDLAPAVRQAFLLSQLEGLRQGEIARRMGISIATVKRHLTKAAMHCYFSESAQRLRALD